MYVRKVVYWFTGITLWIFPGCALVGDETPPFAPSREDRRAYVNDRAANDSLNQAVIQGFRFYAQPGAQYRLSVTGLIDPGSRLYLIRMIHGIEIEYSNYITSKSDSDTLEFSFDSESDDEAEEVWGVVRDSRGRHISGPAENVILNGNGIYSESSFGINYHFWGSYSQIDSDSIPQLVLGIQGTLDTLFLNFGGIQVDHGGPYFFGGSGFASIKFPDGVKNELALPQSDASYLNVVFIESIEADSSGLMILGMAPREARYMHSSKEEVIFISMQSPRSTLANTIAHEVGHFFGLRHTVSTEDDLKIEGDYSNLEDGFTDTELCELGSVISLVSDEYPEGWCLRILAQGENTALCDSSSRSNLMFPVEYLDTEQEYLRPQQIEILHSNLGLLPH
jgi:hypothetical protein